MTRAPGTTTPVAPPPRDEEQQPLLEASWGPRSGRMVIDVSARSVIRIVIGLLALTFIGGVAGQMRDVLVWINTKHWAPIALGQLWYQLDRSSLNLVQAVIQRYIHPFLWDPIIVTILLSWAFAVLMILGVLLLAVFRKRARRYS